MTAPAEALAATLLSITRIPSPIGEEVALCEHLVARLSRTLGESAVSRFANSLVVRVTERADSTGVARAHLPRIALVGHTDTVRTEHEGPARIEGGRLYGAGASDMKSGLAVMIELAERLDRDRLPVDLTLVFYEREEGPYAENGLGPLLDHFPELRRTDLAICLEPSDNKLQLGCMGSIHATLVFHGRTAHSARPWQGDNAITKAAPVLAELAARPPREVVVDGHRFLEVMTPTLASGGRSRNIVPDRFEVNLNFRFAPGRTPEEAVAEVRALVGDRAEVIASDLSPAGRPHASHPLVEKLRTSGVKAVEIKQAWTDVARFDSIGVPAVNFGPGTQAQAHQKNEWTELALLAEGYAILEAFLTA